VSRFVVRPGVRIAGHTQVPGDKSISHRALLLGAVADGATEISGFLPGDDCLATLTALQSMGIEVAQPRDDQLIIYGKGLHGLQPPPGPLDLGNSGTALRLLTGLMAGQAFPSELTGDTALQRRPMERIAEPLRQMGAVIETTDGRPPVSVAGSARLSGIEYCCPVASAQVKSAVLLAGLYANGETRVTEPAPTRDHTERMLPSFGVGVARNERTAAITGPASLKGTSLAIPGDLSSAAFLLGAACLSDSGSVEIEGAGVNPTRTGVLEILQRMGAHIQRVDQDAMGQEPVANLTGSPASLTGITVPAELVPLAIDEFPLIFALAACAQGVTVVTGAEELRRKESDRIDTMVQGLRTLRINAESTPDGARITGGQLSGGTVDSHGDHRVAMAFAIAATTAAAPVTILDVDNVATSFPGFVACVQKLGIDIAYESGDR
jgi:3-phosphoshikimate 1-carboxyvinyltransferase